MNLHDILSRQELFQGLDKEELGQVAGISKMVSFKEDEEIFHENNNESSLYILVEGRVQVKVSLGPSEQATIHTILPGKLFGEFAFIDEQPRSATAVTVKNSNILKFERDAFFGLFGKNRNIGYIVMSNMCKIFARRIRQTAHELRSSLMWERDI